MTDSQIIVLFWDRNEDAIQETDRAYGRRLHVLSDRILRNEQDAQESVSDTYLKTWETIPPQRPTYFFAYLAKPLPEFLPGPAPVAVRRQAQCPGGGADPGDGRMHL